MPKRNITDEEPRRLRPGLTPESREKQLCALAVDLAEQQLLNGTASSQIITHYLKLASPNAQLEREILEEQKKLIKAKTEQIEATKNMDEMYNQAIEAMKRYSGNG